jgi:cysteine synthase
MLEVPIIRKDWKVYLKLEYFNPAGSFKDRTAISLITAAEKSGKLKKGMTLYESSSGNTAKALAMIAAARGYKFVAIVDKHAPADKLNAICAYGGELHFCADDKEKKGGHLVDFRRDMAKKLAEENGGLNLDQYDNPENPLGFYNSLGKEILEQVPNINFIIGTVGTGSSLSGSARYIKEHKDDAVVIALEPQGSSHFSPHGHGYFISGPGYPAGAILPKNIDTSLFDKHDYVSDAEAFNTMRYFAHNKGLLFGDSSGMLLYYAMKYIQEQKETDDIKEMVLIIGDSGESYLSHAFNDAWMIENELMDKQVENDLNEFYL